MGTVKTPILVIGAVVLALAGAAVVLAGARPSQAQPPVTTRTSPDFPDFNTDAVPMIGAVTIANTPVVHAVQADEWGVRLVGEPVVSIRTPGFLEVGQAYEVTWVGSAQPGLYRVRGLGINGWIQAEDMADPNLAVKWLNTALASIIEETRP